MKPGTVIHLVKSITTQGGGVIATYKLNKGASLPVLMLTKEPTAEQLAKIAEILK